MEVGETWRGCVHGCFHCYHFFLLLSLALLILFFVLAWMSSCLHYDSKFLLSIICFSSYVLCRKCTFLSHPKNRRMDGFSGCFLFGHLTDKIFVIPLSSFKTRHRWHQLLKLLLLFDVQVEPCITDKSKGPRTLPLILFCYLSLLTKPDAIKRLKTLLVCLFKNFNPYLPLDFFFINICSKQSFLLICKIVSVKDTTLWNKENLCISVSYWLHI